MPNPCHIIGVLDNGAEGLSADALRLIGAADLVIGATRTLALFKEHVQPEADCRDLTARLAQTPEWIDQARQQGRRVVVLATGDPLCHGVAAYLIGKLGRADVSVIPNVSMIQLACARLALPWQELAVGSVHATDAGEWFPGATPAHGMYRLLQLLRQNRLTGVFTSPENGPDRIARMLMMEGLAADYDIAVAEHLLLPTERVHDWRSVADVAASKHATPNMTLVRRVQDQSRPLFGLADEDYEQRTPEKGLITRREIRAVSLARMGLRPGAIVWDIGAGSGSVGLEAARLCGQGHVYAIEKNAVDVQIALSNRARMQIGNYTLFHGKAPEGLDAWPDPHAVFIGGSGGELAELIRLSLDRLQEGGWLVMNFVTLENLTTAVATLKVLKARWDVTQLQCARSRPILDMNRMQAENPVWIISATRGHDD